MRYASEDPDINRFLKKYDSIPEGYKQYLPWEAIAISVKINPKHLIGAILLAVSSHCATKSRFIIVSNHPDVTQKRVKYAKMASGEKDRTALDILSGAMQGPKGPTFIGKAVFGGGGGGTSSRKDDDEEPATVSPPSNIDDSYNALFPSANEVQEKLVPIRQKLLEG